MSDWLIGLSQGLTNGILFKQRQEEDQFRKTQDILVEQIHRDAANIRPEDRMKLLEPVHAITTAKNQKQLDAAWGRYAAMGIAENYEQERADREYNANLPTETQAPPMIVEGMGAGSLPTIPGKSPAISLPAGPPIQVEGQSDAIPVEVRQSQMRDPNAYAQGKVRYATDEGKAGRQIEVLERRGEIQTAGMLKREEARGKAQLALIQAKAKDQGLEGIRYGYDDDKNLIMMGVNAQGKTVTENLGAISLPQNIISEANIRSREEQAQKNRAQEDAQFAATLKLNKEKLSLAKQEANLKRQEFNEKVRKGYFGKVNGESQKIADRIMRKADNDIDSATARYNVLQDELANLRSISQFSMTDEARYQIGSLKNEMRLLVEQIENIKKSRDAQLDAVEDGTPNAMPERDIDRGTSKGGGGSRPSPNKQPSLKVGSIRQQLGLGK